MSVDDPKSKQLNLTDMGNAERLTLYHGRDVRYCHEWGKWIAWDGRKWTIDESGAIHSRAKSTVRKIYEEAAAVSASAANEKTVDQRKELATLGEKTLSWAKSSESLHRVNAMVQLAKSGAGMPISPSELDADPWLLNCVNGTVNLRTGEMLPHSRENLATKLAPVKYDPDAEAPVFKQFLSQIMGGDKQLITFLQKAFGYALTGDVSEQVLFILYGTGANGKSTLLNTLLGMSGDYSMKAASGLLMAKRSDSHPTERADLFKMRLVAAHESDQGHGLNEAFVKEATGGDPIRACQGRWESVPVGRSKTVPPNATR
ncbi:MAG: phage/plasmid primase, P4 family [Prochlorococcaceae cyanobacterium ETNP2_MAG_10]|jgi:putative DNA primase/helicase|nr:phage/plasmid primase, P4 family [Prochlorococcaceae cyanobacterium ETNP2_MAG_10]